MSLSVLLRTTLNFGVRIAMLLKQANKRRMRIYVCSAHFSF